MYAPIVEIVFSVHKNPAARTTVLDVLKSVPGVTLLEPVDYPTLLVLMEHSYFILTDSGGIQEEAPSLGKPVLVLRKTTERPEGVDAGAAKIVGTNFESVYENAARLLKNPDVYDSMSKAVNPYGDGQAARRTAQAILYHFSQTNRKPDEFTPR